MLSISNPKPAASKGSYYFDYYERDADQKGLWFGKGLNYFGLQGAVGKRQFTNLLNGFTPDGKFPLVKNAGDPKRQAMWDLTFNVPKSVSVAWMVASAELRFEIDRVILDALKETLHEVEEQYGLSRKGAGGRTWVPADLTFALFRHMTSRENQPHIHYHCVLFNLGVKEDATIGTLQTRPLFDAKLSIGLTFRNALADRLSQELGFGIKREGDLFEIDGVGKEVCEHFSKRRHQILEHMDSHNLAGGKQAKIAALETRAPKKHIPKEELLNTWQTEARAIGLTPERIELLVEKKKSPARETEKEKEKAEKKAPPPLPRVITTPEIKTSSQEELCSDKSKAPELSSDKNSENKKLRPEDIRAFAHTARVLARHPLRFDPFRNKTPDELREELERKSTLPDPKVLRAFKAELKEAAARTSPKNQTRHRIERMAFALGKELGVGRETVLKAARDLKFSVYKRRSNFGLGTFLSGFCKSPKWQKIYYAKPLPSREGFPALEFRIQQRTLFPKAPRWSPVSKLTLPALRFAEFRPDVEEKKLREKARQEAQRILRTEQKRFKQIGIS